MLASSKNAMESMMNMLKGLTFAAVPRDNSLTEVARFI